MRGKNGTWCLTFKGNNINSQKPLLGDPRVDWTSIPWVFFLAFLFCFKKIEPPAAPCSSRLAHFYGGPGINFGGQIQVLRPTAVCSQEAHPLPTVQNLPWGLGPHVSLEARMRKEAGPWRKVGKARPEILSPYPHFCKG